MSEIEPKPEFHRIEPRYRLNDGVDVRVLVQPQGSPEPVDAQLVDMSNSGLQLRLSTSLKFDESMAVHILAGDLQFDLAATVKWLREADENSWFLGCHIKPELSEDALDRLATMGLLDRRESLRKEVELISSICGELESTKTPAVIRNLSEDGFGLSTQISRVVGQRVRVTAVNGVGESLEITARVIWQIKTQGGFFCGCAFLARESHTQLNDLLNNEHTGRRRRGRSTRRTSMWVALAALVVFVFPSLIVLLINENAATSPSVVASRETSAGNAAAELSTKSSTDREGSKDTSLKPTLPVNVTPAPATVNAPPESPEPPVVVEESTASATSDQDRADDTRPSDVAVQQPIGAWPFDVARSPPRATEPAVDETPSVDSPVATSAKLPEDSGKGAHAPPQVERWQANVSIGFWLADRASHAIDLRRAIERAFDLANASTTSPASPDALPNESLPPTPADEFRTWVDITGEYRVVAKLVSVEGGDGDGGGDGGGDGDGDGENERGTNGATVRLLKKNGRHTSVPLAKLSERDAEFVRNWLAARP
jgi:cytoskeletal protein RodZ